jgi:hypothetical protein
MAVIWAILALLGVPLWLCAIGIVTLVFRNRGLRKRHGDIPIRVLRPGKTRWTRAHGLWVSDVFGWRASPAAWNEDLSQVVSASVRNAEAKERKALHRLGEQPAVADLTTADGVLHVAVAAERRSDLLGPFVAMADRS